MATGGGSLPRGFAPHHLGPPPRRQSGPLPPHGSGGGSGGYGGLAAPSLIKRPGAGPGVMPPRSAPQRDQYGVHRHQFQQGLGRDRYGSQQHAYGGPQPSYGSPASFLHQPGSPGGGGGTEGWAESSSDSLAPEGYSGSSGFGADASVDMSRVGGAGINGLQQYQPQARGNIGPPFGDTPRAAYGQRSAAPPVPVASDEGYNGHYRTEIDDDTSLIRSEADKIAQRLLKTEQELERLKKQGDIIGESLRKQKALDIENAAASPQAVTNGRAVATQQQAGMPAPLHPTQKQKHIEKPLLNHGTGLQLRALPGAPSPNRAALPPQGLDAQSVSAALSPERVNPGPAPGQPTFEEVWAREHQPQKDVSSIKDIPDHPARNNEKLANAVIDDAQAAALGLPNGSMWFDPNDPAQMQMIKEQLAGKPQSSSPAPPGTALPVPPKTRPPRKATRLVKQEDLIGCRQLLHVPEECDSESQVIRCYKRLAPAAHPSVTQDASAAQLKSLTESCLACLADVRSKGSALVGELGTIGEEEEDDGESASPKRSVGNSGNSEAPEGSLLAEEVDALEFYDEIFFHKTKHAQLKVKMGVALEDLLQGHSAGFDFERRVVNDKGETVAEKCHLQVNVVPGMRPGTRFIFECEGDDAIGCIPGDVCVILKLEPHERFVAAGSDIATEVTMPLTDAVTGAPIGPIYSLSGQKLWLHAPADVVIMPEMVFKAENEGLPLPDETSRRGNLFVKVHVAFPRALKMTDDQKKALRTILEPEPIDTAAMNLRHESIPGLPPWSLPSNPDLMGLPFLLHACSCMCLAHAPSDT